VIVAAARRFQAIYGINDQHSLGKYQAVSFSPARSTASDGAAHTSP
jgi:hypothetical protein